MENEKPRNSFETPRRVSYAAVVILLAAGVAVAIRKCQSSDSAQPPKPSQSAPQSAGTSPLRNVEHTGLLPPYVPSEEERHALSATTARLSTAAPDREANMREACDEIFLSFDAPGDAVFEALTGVRRILSEVSGKKDPPSLSDIREACLPYIIPERMDEVLAHAIAKGDVRVGEEVMDEMNGDCAKKSFPDVTVEPDVTRCETLSEESPHRACINESFALLEKCRTEEGSEQTRCLDALDAVSAACNEKAGSVETRYECLSNARKEAERDEKEARASAKKHCLADRAQEMGVDRDQLSKNWGIAKATKLFAAHTNIMGSDRAPSVDEAVEYGMLLHSILFISEDTDIFKTLSVKDRPELVKKYVDSLIEKFGRDETPESKGLVRSLEFLKNALKIVRK